MPACGCHCAGKDLRSALGISICATVILPNYGSPLLLVYLYDYVGLVDLVRFELTTSSMPWKRAPNCATGLLPVSLADRRPSAAMTGRCLRRLLLSVQIVHTIGTVGFEWDEQSKAGINFRRHGVRMPEAIPVFDDPYAITVTDDESDPNEQRFVTLGAGATGRLLVVVYTWRGENMRIISVRPAEPREQEEYEAGQ
jgi:uncharacterized protein